MNFDRGNMFLISGWVVCLCAWAPLVLGQEQRSIEVIADGQRYESIEKYREARRAKLKMPAWNKTQAGKRKTVAGLLRKALYRRYTSSVLTGGRHYTGPKDIERYLYPSMGSTEDDQGVGNNFDPFLESYSRISRLGFNTGVARIVEEFRDTSQDGIKYKRLMPKDLETTLSRSFEAGDYTGPILIISHQKKLRIMTLEGQNIKEGGAQQ